MSTPLTLIVLGQAYFLGSPSNSTSDANGVWLQSIHPPVMGNETRRPDYTYTPGIGSYKVHTKVTTWVKALAICQEEGAHLAVINSPTEANVIAQVFEKAGRHADSYSPNYAWIGTHDLISHVGNYETIFGQSLADAGFNEWHEEKSHDGPHCGAVWRDGKLSWFGCNRALGFICELSPTGPTLQTYITGDDKGSTQATSWLRESLIRRLGNVGTTVP